MSVVQWHLMLTWGGALFCKDDDLITGTDKVRVQASLGAITSSFAMVWLKMNACKTKFSVLMTGGTRNRQWTQSAQEEGR